MMYRHHTQLPSPSPRRRAPRRRWVLAAAAVMVVLLVSMHVARGSERTRVAAILRDDDAIVKAGSHHDDQHRVYRRRIVRSEIPPLNFHNIAYRQLFNDSNYVQLSAARANGLDPATVGDPAANDALVPIFSTSLYSVDTMYHSVPYLLPETVLLLDYIAHRFKALMAEHYPSIGEHNVIVTSALRTEQSERRLRHVNRNATDTSCHIYGTTFDLSAQRYLHLPSGSDTVVDACKQMLALALYELRYEGLCYVKYERGSCFHITLRTTQYEGNADSETRSYVNPGSPDYLLTKAPPRPAPRATVNRTAAPVPQSRHHRNGKAHRRTSATQKTQAAPQNNSAPRSENHNNRLTDRERISLEQFER